MVGCRDEQQLLKTEFSPEGCFAAKNKSKEVCIVFATGS